MTTQVVSDEEKIAADDPRMLPLWASIAKEAITNGTMDHYLQIAEAIGAPTVKELRDKDALTGHTQWRVYIYFDFKSPLVGGKMGETFTADDIRAAMTEYMTKPDDEIVSTVNRDSQRIVWDR